MLMVPMVLDAGQTAGDVLEVLSGIADTDRPTVVVIRWRNGVRVRWFVLNRSSVVDACTAVASNVGIVVATGLATRDRDEAEPRDAHELSVMDRKAHGWLVMLSGTRMIGLAPPHLMNGAPPPPRRTRGQRAKPVAPPAPPPVGPPPTPVPAGAEPVEAGAGRGSETPADASADVTDTLLAMPRVELPDRCVPGIDNGVMLSIGLRAPTTPTETGVMAFVSARTQNTIDIDVMVEAPDFTCAEGWKHTLTVDKSDPFSKSLDLHLFPSAPEDKTVRLSTVRVHYSYKGQPAGTAVRRIALGDATLEDAETIVQPAAAPLQIAPSSTPVDLTIRVSRRDESDAARELLWTILDCAHPIKLPDAPIAKTVGGRDTTSSFAAKLTSQVNAADGTEGIDTTMRAIGTMVERTIPSEVLKALADVAAAVGSDRLARVLLLTDESFIPWELALLDPPPNAARAPYLGAQFAISRWIHGDEDVAVPPPAALRVANLAVVLGNYDATSLNALPHAKEEADALLKQATEAPTRFPHVTNVPASLSSLVDLINGALPSPTGVLAPEMVHFACHGEVLGTGIAKRSVLYMSDGTAMPESLFIASTLGKKTKSFLFMNACQVGVGGEELGKYSGFPGFALIAGFSGFIGPLWSVNDQIAKGIALDFYTRAFGADGSAPRPVADVLADMRSQYASEPDPKKRQSTWLAYVHYGHPHFTLSHA